MSPVANKVAFITGGAGGVGAEVARRLHGLGGKVVLIDLDCGQLEARAAELGDDRVLTVCADVRDLCAMQEAADRTVEHFGGIDILIANAGIVTFGSVLQVDPNAFQSIMDVNVVGVFHAVRAGLPSVLERRGYVLIVSSMAAYAAAPGMAPYNTAKAAVEHFANALRLEVGSRGVAVGSAHMAWVDTPMLRNSMSDLSAFRELVQRLPGQLGKITSVQECGAIFVEGIEKRARRINCPRWVNVFQWLKPVMASSFAQAQVATVVTDLLPRLDSEVAALGRSVTEHTKAIL
ncbi:SDR family oxidoreductase [Mycobacterium kansasii]|uniref:Short-chain dehydrogenase n=1 Tax=Mycobacterium kansasii ATCC 12478 TaxID=557599 RepID=U5WK06_MYCKA|nr:SDR family oxidoreductase [Mycobacterium kansasii]AGZ49302.1 short-chain dehydrogenase [Mycobacterium kansasii ATCC 12478]ARG58745.1 short-chain dehydrogenase [Mycobacterium kansasii]ARG71912.1 short-chain dehydrogenase [Mycobacterium kansasii]ARG73585.1 short-chain dehydrogenase [Mycobacterium kansasii]ARG79010.1 short-chain dehydrogenase [Mycobacterium kansasii]